MLPAQMDRNKTKEQLDEEKKISLAIRIKPLDLTGLNEQKLRAKATELWDLIVKLETEKYDLEERQKRQDYDVSLDTVGVASVGAHSDPIPLPPTVEGVEGATEAAAEAQGPEEGLGPRGLDRQVPAHDPGRLQVREARGHPFLRRQEETLRRCKYPCPPLPSPPSPRKPASRK